MSSNIQIRPLNMRRMGDFENFLTGKEFGGCYCAVWAGFDKDWVERCRNRPHENLEHTRARVKAGEPVGYLAYHEVTGAVVGWTGSGPKTSFPLLKKKPGSRLGPFDESVWAIACLAVGFKFRGSGFARDIVKGVVEEAREAGAVSVEAYPLDPAPEEGAYRGDRKLYEEAGFIQAGSEPAGERLALRMELVLKPGEVPASPTDIGELKSDTEHMPEPELEPEPVPEPAPSGNAPSEAGPRGAPVGDAGESA